MGGEGREGREGRGNRSSSYIRESWRYRLRRAGTQEDRQSECLTGRSQSVYQCRADSEVVLAAPVTMEGAQNGLQVGRGDSLV